MQQGETKGTILLKTPEELLNYTKSEEAMFEKFVQGVAEAGVNVVIGGGSISDVALHYFEKYKIMVIKVLSKFEVKRIAKACGASSLVKLGTPSPEEIGHCESVKQGEISSTRVTIFKRDEEANRMATIVIRSATNSSLDDLERAIDDGVNTLKGLVKDRRMVAGAGATEIHLASHLANFAKQQPGLDQYAVEKFGQAFEVIPRTLAENAGLKAEEIIAKLYAETKNSPHFGIDVSDGNVKNVVEAGILDTMESKTWAVKLTIDAVLTILKVDQIIMSKPAGGPNMDKRPVPQPDGY